MKTQLLVLAFLLNTTTAALADVPNDAPPAPLAAASAPASAAEAASAAASAPVIVYLDGRITRLQECGERGGLGTTLGKNLLGLVFQLGGSAGKAVGAELVGNVVGSAAEGERKICVRVSFKDGTPDMDTTVDGYTYDTYKLRYRNKVEVIVADGTPTFIW